MSSPEKNPVPEVRSPNGIPLQGPFLALEDVEIRTPGSAGQSPGHLPSMWMSIPEW
jgi:hypothetical protein